MSVPYQKYSADFSCYLVILQEAQADSLSLLLLLLLLQLGLRTYLFAPPVVI